MSVAREGWTERILYFRQWRKCKQIPPAPPKRNPILLDGVFFLMKKGGFERPLRKYAGGMFLGRGKIHDLANAPKRVWA